MDSGVLWAEQHIRLKRCREGAFIYNINDAFIGRALDKYGEISREEIIFLSQLIRPGMTVVEVGANIGLLTVPFARLVAPEGKVIAFEPQRIVYQMLCSNLALNALTNVFAQNSAIGRERGSITVPPVDYAKTGNFGGVSLRGRKEGETVPLLTIDSLLLDRCDFMKIDVEGMELDVLQGAARTLERFRPSLYLENDRPENSSSLIRHLLALDYRLYWHFPLLYNADNYFGDGEDIFPGIVSDNMVAIPRTGPLPIGVAGLIEVTSEDASPPRNRGKTMNWSQGYVADIAYTANFYRETAPNHIAFAALSVGRSPGRAFRPNRMLELGFGQGFGLSLLAAANPDVYFEGHDFNPEHVAHARRLIASAKLDNITVTESSFEEAAERGGADDVDVIALHGIYSWVSRGAQDAIVSVIRQRLQPDGMLYISYNCMPGWAPIAPIRTLMVEVKRRNAGRSERQLALALDIVNKLKQGGAAYFAVNPAAAQHVDQMLTLDRVYLAHEYLDEHWELLHFSELAQRMGLAKLTYVGSATLLENLDQYAVPPELMPLMREIDDPIMREMLRDYAGNRRFRRDLFTRGLATLTGSELRRRLSELGFALIVPRKQAIYSLPGPLMQLNVRPEFYDPVYDRLAEKPASFDELAALPAYGEDKLGQLLDCLCLLVSSGQVAPVIAAESIDREPARRFNRMIVDFARAGRNYGALAAPLVRSGVAVGDLALLALAAVFDGKADDPEMAAKHAMSILKVLGRRPLKDGALINDEIAAVDFLASAYRPILEANVPLWRQLGML